MDIFENETDSFSEMGTQDDSDIKDFLRMSACTREVSLFSTNRVVVINLLI